MRGKPKELLIKPKVAFASIFVLMSLSCGRRSILCHGRKQAAAFLHSPAPFKTHHLKQPVATLDHRHRYPILRKHVMSFSSTAPNNVPKQSKEAGIEYDFDRILPFEKHTHNSIKITVTPNQQSDLTNNPFDNETFHSKLQATEAMARQLHKSAIWITVPISRSRLIERAGMCGFQFHHAEGTAATLSKWLLDNEESRIPTFATHQVGVGAVVINTATNEILCVTEKRNNYRPWKMPGGLAELGEHLDEAVTREVYEETGIKCRFLSVLGVRHTHGLQFGRSDLYFVCRLEPIANKDGEVPEPVPQEGEIEAAAWVPLKEYRDMVFNPDSKVGHPMMQQIMKIVDQGNWDEYDIQRTVVSSVVPGRKGSPVYHAAIRGKSV
jgi:ADP-ribose pyrophosphatase YjhB (NUDIX family)